MLRALLPAAAAALTLAALTSGLTPASLGPAAADASTSCSVEGGDATALVAALRDLGPDSCRLLLVGPGRYDVEPVTIHVSPGAPDRPVTVRAADPAQRPIITGGLDLVEASYWLIDGLRFLGTRSVEGDPVHGIPPLYLHGGRGWAVVRSEFAGSRGFQSATLFAVGEGTTSAGSPDYAQGFRIVDNCFHHASEELSVTDRNKDHLLYARQPLPPSVPALQRSEVSRNLFWSSTNGGAIKLGMSNVGVSFNTFHHVSNAVVFQAELPPTDPADDPFAPLHDIAVSRNLVVDLVDVRGGSGALQRDRAFQASDLANRVRGTATDELRQAVFVNNRVWNHALPYDYVAFGGNSPRGEVRLDTPVAAQVDPLWAGGRAGISGCGPSYYRPRAAGLRGFGRYGVLRP